MYILLAGPAIILFTVAAAAISEYLVPVKAK